MSLYNMLHGTNALAGALLAMLELEPNGPHPVGRFRDIHLSADGTQIVLLTRNGGGNREHWSEEEREAGPECGCTGCIITYNLPQHPNYIEDRDDDYDCTYAYVTFSVPEKYAEFCKGIATGVEPETLQQKFETVLAALSAGGQNEGGK